MSDPLLWPDLTTTPPPGYEVLTGSVVVLLGRLSQTRIHATPTYSPTPGTVKKDKRFRELERLGLGSVTPNGRFRLTKEARAVAVAADLWSAPPACRWALAGFSKVERADLEEQVWDALAGFVEDGSWSRREVTFTAEGAIFKIPDTRQALVGFLRRIGAKPRLIVRVGLGVAGT